MVAVATDEEIVYLMTGRRSLIDEDPFLFW